jgi:DNA-binding NarL/FixJ family response regulator
VEGGHVHRSPAHFRARPRARSNATEMRAPHVPRAHHHSLSPQSHPPTTKPGVVVAAAAALVRVGIAASLAESWQVLGTAGTAMEARRLLAALQPRLLVLVLSPPFPDCPLEVACSTLIDGAASVATVVLAHDEDDSAVRAAARYGARGFVSTFASPEQLTKTMQRVHAGEIDADPRLVRHLLAATRSPAATSASQGRLTPAELTVLQLLARGYSSKQIAAVLQSTTKATDMRIQRATRKLGANHRTHAVVIAIRRGLVAASD